MVGRAARSPLFPYTTLFRSGRAGMNLTVQKPLFNLADLPVRDLDRQLARQLLHYETRLHANASAEQLEALQLDRKSTRLNSSHVKISYAVFCLKKKKIQRQT